MQKIATLILPVNDNKGESLADVHASLQADLVDMFGGFTFVSSHGAYKTDTGKIMFEPGFSYQIAMDDSTWNRRSLRTIAKHVATLAEQESVMIIHTDGEIEFVRSYDAITELTKSLENLDKKLANA